MKQITVISGKGGTGKTVISGALAGQAQRKVMVDCDVDAANLHLLLHPKNLRREKFFSGKAAWIDKILCSQCGRCLTHCRFHAISDGFVVDPTACEGCALCSRICPVSAVRMVECLAGEWFISETLYGPLVHARLGVAAQHSGKLTTVIRKAAEVIARRDNMDYIIIDGPPGIGCPVMASLTGVDCALIVGEPSLSGLSDAQRIMEIVRRFRIPIRMVVNKWDLNPEITEALEKLCRQFGGRTIGRLPFDKTVVEMMAQGKILTASTGGGLGKIIAQIWEALSQDLVGQPKGEN